MPPVEMTNSVHSGVYPMPIIPAPFSTTQRWSKRAMGYLWSQKDKLDDQTVVLLDTLYKSKKKGAIECDYVSTYKVSSHWDGFGRYYGSGASIEKIQNEVRATLADGRYLDYDIVNCHPTLLVQFAKRYWGVVLGNLQHYVENRDAILDCFSSRDEGKSAFINVVFGGATTDERLKPLQSEISSFVEHLKSYAPFSGLLEKCRNHIKNEAKKGIKKSLNGSFLSRILHTEERRCADVMMANAKAQGFSPDVYCYDGIMVFAVEGKVLDITVMEKAVFDSTGYIVSIKNKPMIGFEVPVEPDVKEEELEIYRCMKQQFEVDHFYFVPGNTYVEVRPNGSLLHMDIKHATTYFNMRWHYSYKDEEGRIKSCDFFPKWLGDKTRHAIHSIDMKPSTDPTVFSAPLKLAYKNDMEVTEEQREKGSSVFKRLLSIIQEELLRTTLIQWLAHIVQQPFTNPIMAIIMAGPKGCGKDTLGDLICEWVIGNAYSQNYTSTEQYWDKHDIGRVNKLFIKLEEAQGALNISHSAEMKARITGKDMIANQKNVSPYTCSNYNRTFMTTNEGNPVDLSEGERRFMIIPCSGDLVGNHEFWTEVREVLFNPVGGKIIGELLEGIDTGSWPRVPPKSEMAKMMIEEQKSSELRFVDNWDGKEVSMSELFVLYKDYCVTNHLPHALSAKSLGMKLITLVRDGIIIRNHSRDGSVYSRAAH